MKKVAVYEEDYGWFVDEGCRAYEADVEIPDELHARWSAARAALDEAEREIVAIARKETV